MITPEQIRAKSLRKYTSFLQTLVRNETFDRIVITGDKSYTKSSLQEFEREIRSILSQSKDKNGYGYSLDFQKVKTKYLGTQDLPTAIYFDTEIDFLKYLNKEKEVKVFEQNIRKIIDELPELKEWIIQYPSKIIANEDKWEDLIKVCQYFLKNPIPRLYLRELPIKVHTKFIEQNQGILKELLDLIISDNVNKEEKQFEKRFNLKYSEPQVRFKILDQEISKSYFQGLNDIAIPVGQFESLNLPIKRVLVVENKTTLYTTLTLPKMTKTIAIFGSGYSINNLKNAKWLSDIELLYWGDIDAQGFEILSQFRSYFNQTRSILMDRETFDKFFEYDAGTVSYVTADSFLNEQERELYDLLKTNNWRLEQEKIPLEYVRSFFDKLE
ncbi:DUF2220 family protein [Reichenbachiella agarivorans]|uniref:DUF2220 family protein n=1 Tax=Reichenbachiella agarivorans TaxID=2979464 RepID=A0ABY6CUQ5_9BACT|nr:Wadjet anti-phage system protein JetD domain-containing protein [Reichenbachiella agarivorans]UXP34069.1 DUF2220 family protein [Reichenbachiella agarivorans]